MRKTFSDLVNLMQKLRSPDGCPWDREQTYESLKPFVIEEAYEVVEAIDRNDRDGLREEIGDLLLEAVFLAEIARAEGAFEIDDAITAVHDKLVRRHPHVFGNVTASSADQVITNWERIKSEERREKSEGLLAGVPKALPALLKASRLTEKAARAGFDWSRTDDIIAKLREETGELAEAIGVGHAAAIEEEIGDLLFTLVNIARRLEVNAEEALQATNRKFTRRFESIETSLRRENRSIHESTLEELDALWDEAKRDEKLNEE